jgi:hypothetical protein
VLAALASGERSDLAVIDPEPARVPPEPFRYLPAPYRVQVQGATLAELVQADRTTQLDVVLAKDLSRSLFVFHRGDVPRLHLSWDRAGRVDDEGKTPR